jgi:hypothetical protein
MERIVKIFNSFNEAAEEDILQEVGLTPEKRLQAAKELRDRYYGVDAPDVKDSTK